MIYSVVLSFLINDQECLFHYDRFSIAYLFFLAFSLAIKHEIVGGTTTLALATECAD
jgi:hypothetical protein